MKFWWWTRLFRRAETRGLESARAVEPEFPAHGFPPPASLKAQALSRALGCSVTVASWLERQGHVEAEATRRFLNPRLARSASSVGVDTRTAAHAPWNHPMDCYRQPTGHCTRCGTDGPLAVRGEVVGSGICESCYETPLVTCTWPLR